MTMESLSIRLKQMVDETGSTTGVGTYYREVKASYSNTGEYWMYGACDQMTFVMIILALVTIEIPYYTLDGCNLQSLKDYSTSSSGTPIVVGLMATKLEYNRDWTWADMKNWFSTLGSADLTDVHLQFILELNKYE